MGRAAAIALMLLVAACAGPRGGGKAPEAAIQRLVTLSPASLGRSLSLTQLVVAEYGGRTWRMRLEVEITPAALRIVGLSPVGATLFTLVQTGEDIEAESMGMPGPAFDPRYMLFDMYVTYWPIEALVPAMAAAGLRIEECHGGALRRVLQPDGAAVAEVTFPPRTGEKNEIAIRHYDHDYRLRIATLDSHPARRPATFDVAPDSRHGRAMIEPACGTEVTP